MFLIIDGGDLVIMDFKVMGPYLINLVHTCSVMKLQGKYDFILFL